MIPMLLKMIKLKRGSYDKLISMLLKFIADREHAFSLAFRLSNLDRYDFPIRITIETAIRVAKNASFSKNIF